MAGVTAPAGALEDDELEQAPAWAIYTTFVLAFIALGISTYLTIEHFSGNSSLVCVSGISNCAKVTTSAESHFLGIPVAVLGLVQYVAMCALCSPWGWRSTRREVHIARLIIATVGIGFVLWLVAAELILIKAICIWCTGVHVLTFAIFLIVVQTVPRMLGWTRR